MLSLLQVKSSGHEIIELQQQLQHSQRQVLQQLPRKPQDPFLSPDTSVVSQLRAQISKSEYEVARQAAQILELQGELTKVQVIYDRSAQRQTETSAQLTRQESTASRHATNNLQLQEQVAEAQITAASQDNRISQLQAELVDSNSSLVEAQQQSSQLKEELTQAQGLSAQLQSASSKLQMHSDEQSTAAASRAAAEADLRAKLEAQQAAQIASGNKFEQELKSLHKLAAAAQKQEDNLHAEVQCLPVCYSALSCASSRFHVVYAHKGHRRNRTNCCATMLYTASFESSQPSLFTIASSTCRCMLLISWFRVRIYPACKVQ